MEPVLWWELYPRVLDREIELLSDAGWIPKENDDAKKVGKLIIHIELKIHGHKRNAQIRYPDLYPYFRPLVYVDGLGILRHYNPYDGHMCLLKRGTDQWQPEESAYEHIRDMLPRWEEASVRRYSDDRLDGEDHQAEPVTAYLPQSNQLIAIDSGLNIPEDCTHGTARITIPCGLKEVRAGHPFLGWTLSLSDEQGDVFSSAVVSDEIIVWLNTSTSRYEKIEVEWCKLVSLPVPFTVDQILNRAVESSERFGKKLEARFRNRKGGILGFCVQEEAPQGGMCQGWFFLNIVFPKVKGKNTSVEPQYTIINAEYAGEKDIFERIPELNPLRKKTIAVIGLGCVGAPSVLEFAKSGVGELRLLDADHVSPGTIPRWPLGLAVAGQGKVRVLIEHIRRNYPFTKIGNSHHMDAGDDLRLSVGAPGSKINQRQVLNTFLDGVDLIYDASAEIGISQLMADLATERKLPLVVAASRPGGWGGDVVRVMPNSESGCLLCYLHGQISGDIPNPVYDEQGDDLQPVGCADVTFTATSFDVQTISLAGVRVAISTLCSQEEGYPDMDSDYGIVTVRENGKAIFPRWQSGPLPKHSNCPLCGHK